MPVSSRKTKKERRYFIIDFDSTFVRDETLEVLASEALKDHPKKEEILKKIARITNAGMEGKLSFSESLERRLKLFSANRTHVAATAAYLRTRVSPSIARNRDFFRKNAKDIYIVSNGFKECIIPVAKESGIAPAHVLANTLRFDAKGVVRGVAPGPLARDKGKSRAIAALKLKGEVVVVGDGMTDAEVRSSGAAGRFFAFTENVYRAPVVEKADAAVGSFDELLYLYGIERALSYPKNRLKALLLESVHPFAAEHLRKEGYQVEALTKALSEEELKERIHDISILGIRSATSVSDTVLAAAPRLLAIGAFCIGTNQVDLRAAARRGIAVFNAPFANGRSVVELAAGLIIALSRRLCDKSADLHAGKWDKSARSAHEIRGKTLGIVGYGNIGSQLSVVAESLGMNVVFYDIAERPAIGNARRAESLAELLRTSDIVTLHVDGRALNRGFFGKDQFSAMKPGALFLNLSRGFVIDISALAEALKNGRVAGAAVDVFPEEPKGNPASFVSPLQGLSNVILTPHIGGSTEEAQENIARFLAQKLDSFVDTGGTMLSVNFPNLQLPVLQHAHRFIHIHQNVPGVLAAMNTLMSGSGVNILGQYLGTMNDIGYVITDTEETYQPGVVEALKRMPETIRFRVLY